jgi:hypothetical protein
MQERFAYEGDRKAIKSSFSLETYEKIVKRAKRNDRPLGREVVNLVRKALEQEESQFTPVMEHK